MVPGMYAASLEFILIVLPSPSLPANRGFLLFGSFYFGGVSQVYAASSLPHTPLSRYIEWRVRQRLASLENEKAAATLSIRLISNVEVGCCRLLFEHCCCGRAKLY